MPEMSAEQLDKIAARVADELTDRKRALWVEPETHHRHHAWVDSKIVDEEEIKALKKKIIESAVIWAVPIIIGFVVSIFWDGLLAFIKQAAR